MAPLDPAYAHLDALASNEWLACQYPAHLAFKHSSGGRVDVRADSLDSSPQGPMTFTCNPQSHGCAEESWPRRVSFEEAVRFMAAQEFEFDGVGLPAEIFNLSGELKMRRALAGVEFAEVFAAVQTRMAKAANASGTELRVTYKKTWRQLDLAFVFRSPRLRRIPLATVQPLVDGRSLSFHVDLTAWRGSGADSVLNFEDVEKLKAGLRDQGFVI